MKPQQLASHSVGSSSEKEHTFHLLVLLCHKWKGRQSILWWLHSAIFITESDTKAIQAQMFDLVKRLCNVHSVSVESFHVIVSMAEFNEIFGRRFASPIFLIQNKVQSIASASDCHRVSCATFIFIWIFFCECSWPFRVEGSSEHRSISVIR